MRRIAASAALLVAAVLTSIASAQSATKARAPRAQELILTNPLNVDRPPEVVEIPLTQVLDHLHLSLAQVPALVAVDAATGQPIPHQIYGDVLDAPPDQLLLLVHLAARGRQRIIFHVDPGAPKPPPWVFGREAPERKDDFAWENKLVAYRVYGPALQATGEITSGIDVWSKRIPNFVIDTFYKRDAKGARTHNPALSYHIDNGQGLDSYYVGPSRGCGGTAVFSRGKLIASKNYTTLHVLGNGPIRFSFEVSYAPWDAHGVTVSETKRITLDAGTHMNRIQSTYTFEGASTLELAAGIAVHKEAIAEIPAQGNIASIWDVPQLPSAGRIATGLVADPRQHAKTLIADGHALLVFTRHSGESFSYLAGAGWSQADMPTADDWNAYLKLQLQMVQHPILRNWKDR
ncbi:MAG: DUF4861 family protein [Terracidiphilus sp.]|jgi:hypothetical protein